MLTLKKRMDDVGELIWEHNMEMALQALENDDVDSYTRRREISDCRA